jgi:uncharacterized protein YdeI (YjbR/CyaY-like superfamily)
MVPPSPNSTSTRSLFASPLLSRSAFTTASGSRTARLLPHFATRIWLSTNDKANVYAEDAPEMTQVQPAVIRAADDPPTFFGTAAQFRVWLRKNAGKSSVLIVGFYKVGSGEPSLTWPESVDEALCFAWIDGVRKRVDDKAYQIRFTPRKPGSIWSRVNIARAEALIAAGRMQPAGLAAFQRRLEHKSGVYAYEQRGSQQLAPVEATAFRKHRRAWSYFETVAPSYRKVMLHWVVSAKQPATRARRLAKLIEGCAKGERLLP